MKNRCMSAPRRSRDDGLKPTDRVRLLAGAQLPLNDALRSLIVR